MQIQRLNLVRSSAMMLCGRRVWPRPPRRRAQLTARYLVIEAGAATLFLCSAGLPQDCFPKAAEARDLLFTSLCCILCRTPWYRCYPSSHLLTEDTSNNCFSACSSCNTQATMMWSVCLSFGVLRSGRGSLTSLSSLSCLSPTSLLPPLPSLVIRNSR